MSGASKSGKVFSTEEDLAKEDKFGERVGDSSINNLINDHKRVDQKETTLILSPALIGVCSTAILCPM